MKFFSRCLLGIMLLALTGCAASYELRPVRRQPPPQILVVRSDGSADSSAVVESLKDSLFREWALAKSAKTSRRGGEGWWSKARRGLNGALTARASETGVVQVETHDVRGQLYSAFQSKPQLFQQLPPNLGSGWRDVTGNPYLYMPYGAWSINLRLQPHGNTLEIGYRYDEEFHWINAPVYYFSIPNSGDDGLHDLVTYVRYRNGAIDSTFYRVQNNRVQ